MVNSKDFAKRLEKVMEYHDLSAASFADQINVGRSSISHILSGRNKPSLDFVLKIVDKFPEVELYWLLNGKGIFPKSKATTSTPVSSLSEKSTPKIEFETPQKNIAVNEQKEVSEKIIQSSAKKKIHKIIIFYEDGSFEAFEN
ncbi:helix-turn-helix domain-containing protein [Mesonia aestuariivivens]|uniref:Helix-turn-helix domain-containing protein n=1 Tax=Mesonia aestuariivivens TaxID=2796128 RepID=A0ABS6VYM8_9FLAO|nr:helix-turn-helix transcriptional regulator [Mesonia aestuariivivens]MBW2960700.1 helix-turn-helix domain-containing protein [Mesonia aestuariivivens]